MAEEPAVEDMVVEDLVVDDLVVDDLVVEDLVVEDLAADWPCAGSGRAFRNASRDVRAWISEIEHRFLRNHHARKQANDKILCDGAGCAGFGNRKGMNA
jgi:hypothetical protein